MSKPYNKAESGSLVSKAPSNIALIKYWGKYEGQIPANASISYTLSECFTEMQVHYEQVGYFQLDFTFEGQPNKKFSSKMEKYLLSIQKEVPFIATTKLTIDSKNTFPHSSGIASSASAFAALALALVKIEAELNQSRIPNLQKASHLARLGSGSAARSVYSGLVVWGKTELIENSSDEYAIPYPYEIPEDFKQVKDAIAIIHAGEKKVSSTAGHGLMQGHAFAEQRFLQANNNFLKLKDAIENNDLWKFGEVIESEALSLHSMMMTSNPNYLLMEPNSLQVIKEIRAFRENEKVPIFFTLDAGPNVHILYPDKVKEEVSQFLSSVILPLTVNDTIIHDHAYFV